MRFVVVEITPTINYWTGWRQYRATCGAIDCFFWAPDEQRAKEHILLRYPQAQFTR